MAGEFADIAEVVPQSAVDGVLALNKAVADGIPNITKFADIVTRARESAQKLGESSGLSALSKNAEEAKASQDRLAKSLSDLSRALEEHKKMADATATANAKISASSSQQAKDLAAAKVELREQTKALIAEAEAQNKAVQARNAAAAAAAKLKEQNRSLAEQEKELLRLIKEEERTNLAAKRKEEIAARKQQVEEAKKLALAEKELQRAQADERKKAVGAVAIDSNVALSRTLNDLRKGYDLLTEAERKNEHIGGVLLARIKELDTQLKASDAATGRFQRNVGNYSSAAAGLSRSLGMIAGELPNLTLGMRTFGASLSNNIGPLIDSIKQFSLAQKEAYAASVAAAEAKGVEAAATAVAGGASEEAAGEVGELAKQQALAAIEGNKGTGVLKAFGRAMFSMTSMLTIGITMLAVLGPKLAEAAHSEDDLTESQKALNQATADGAAAYSEVATKLHAMERRFRDVKATMEDKKQIVKELNDEYGNQIGELKGIADAEDFFVNRSKAFIDATSLRAKAQGALNAIMKAQEANITAATRDLTTNGDVLGATFKNMFSIMGRDFSGAAMDLQKRNSELQRDEILANNEVIKTATEQYGQLLTEADALAKKHKFNFGKPDPKQKKGGGAVDMTDETLAIQARITKAEAEGALFRIETQKEALQAIFEDETKSLEERLKAREEFYQQEYQQIIINSNLEAEVIEDKLKKITEIEGKSAKNRTNEEKQLVAEKLALQAEQKLIADRQDAQFAKIERQRNKDTQVAITKDTEEQLAKRRALLDNDIAQLKLFLSDKELAERVALSKRFAEGKIGEEKYRNELDKLNHEYDKKELEGTRDLIMKKMQELQKGGAMTEAEEKRLSDVIRALALADANYQMALDQKTAANKQKLQERWIAAAKEVLDTIIHVQNAGLQRELVGLEKRGAQIDKNKEKEIEAIQLSTLTEEEKQKRIQEAEARAQLGREQMEARQRVIQRKQAANERNAAIASIIQNTAVAVLAAMKVGPPTAIPLAIATGVIGAAQLARVIATPLPAYAEGAGIDGKPKHKGGYALVGDNPSGREYIIEPGRRPYAVDGEQVLDLKRNTTVIPEERLNALGYDMLTPKLIRGLQQQRAGSGNGEVIKTLDKWGARHERAILSSGVQLKGVNIRYSDYVTKWVKS